MRTWDVPKLIQDFMIGTVKEFEEKFPDKYLGAYSQGEVAVIVIPNGRLKIMPKHRKPRYKKKPVKK
jgi:hypothetical protein